MKKLPAALQLPSGRVVHLAQAEKTKPRKREGGAPLFADAILVFESGDVAMKEDGVPITVHGLELRDFHALRAILTYAGHLEEDEVEVTCRNCEATMAHRPCAAFPLGPFEDRELGDPELDATLDLSASYDITEIPLGRVRAARSITLSPLTVDDAAPLFRARAAKTFTITGDVVRGMGILELGPEKNPARIARALSVASPESLAEITDLYLAAHYPLRLFTYAICKKCGARNEVNAPFEREFEDGQPDRRPDEKEHVALPSFDAFAERAKVIADRLFEEEGVDDVNLVVEGGVPAVDDGGVPLMGGYLHASPGDMNAPSSPHEISIYYRTFRAIWDEDGPYDWDAELRETIEHELDHHLAYLAGDDPMADEEHEEIQDEAMRVLGKKAVVREGVRSLPLELKEFFARTWLIWVLIAVATAIVTLVR